VADAVIKAEISSIYRAVVCLSCILRPLC